MDYLFGKVDVKCPDVEMLDISNKTGLSVKAVERLMAKETVSLEEYLTTVYQLGFMDGPPPYDNSDEDDEESYYETDASVSQFWSGLIESDQFMHLPENWHRLVCTMYAKTGIKIYLDDLMDPKDEMPTLDEYTSLCFTWQRLFPHDKLFIKAEHCEEVYNEDPNLAQSSYVEIRNEFRRKLENMSDELENTIIGYTGKIERSFMGLLEQKALEWQKTGPLWPLEDNHKQHNNIN